MGTSMTVPDSAQLRLTRKAIKQNENRATYKLTPRRLETMQENLIKASVPSLGINDLLDKIKECPDTAVTEDNRPGSPSNVLQLKEIQISVKDAVPAEEDNQQQSDKQNPPRSIWSNMTDETKIHFRHLDQKRKKSILGVSSLFGLENKIDRQQEQQLHSERANQIFLSINSKFSYREHQAPETTREACTKNEEKIRKIIKKSIPLVGVEIVEREREKKKLKYVCREDEADYNWRNTS